MELQNLLEASLPILDNKGLQLLQSISKILSIQAGHILVKEGEVNRNIFLVLNGLLRSYVITSEGIDRTILLTKEGMRTASFKSFLENRPSDITIEAIEPSKILAIDSLKFQELSSKYSQLALAEKQGMQLFLSEAIERLHHFTTLTPAERYKALQKSHPDLIQRVPQKYLASYLGITTVSLSRIRSRLSSS